MDQQPLPILTEMMRNLSRNFFAECVCVIIGQAQLDHLLQLVYGVGSHPPAGPVSVPEVRSRTGSTR